MRGNVGFAGRIAPCLYNNVIAANEENWYKIAGSSGPIRGGPVSEREQHNTRGSDRAGRSPMAAAATSAAISMEMRWMSAISYDKISAQKRRCPGRNLGPARGILQPRKPCSWKLALFASSSLPSLLLFFRQTFRSLILLPSSLSNGYQSLTGEKRETVILMQYLFIYTVVVVALSK